MEPRQCPSCGRRSMSVVQNADGSEQTRCSTCGWVGPFCFGLKHDRNNPKCAGGPDVSFWSSDSHRREPCSYYGKCQEATVQQARQQIEIKSLPVVSNNVFPQNTVQGTQFPQNTVSRPHPVLPQMPSMPPMASMPQAQAPQTNMMSLQQALQHRQALPTPVQPQYAQPQQVLPRAPQSVPQTYGGFYHGQQQQVPVYYVAPQNAMVPMAVPQNHVAPGSQVPSYLTVPEPYNGAFMPMFMASVMRAGLKGMFLTASNLMDHVPWGSYVPPGT